MWFLLPIVDCRAVRRRVSVKVKSQLPKMASSSASKVLVVLGSVRDGRNGIKVAKLVVNHLKKAGMEPTLIDPLEIDAPMLKQPLHFRPPSEQEKAPEWMKKLNTQIKEAHGIVLVSAEYNATIPPALTNLLDHCPPGSYRHKPCSLVTYSLGSLGGSRVKVALMPFVNELGMVLLPSGLTVPSIGNVKFDDDGNTQDERVAKNATKLCEEMRFYAEAVAKKKEEKGAFPN